MIFVPVFAGHPYGIDAPESEMIFIFFAALYVSSSSRMHRAVAEDGSFFSSRSGTDQSYVPLSRRPDIRTGRWRRLFELLHHPLRYLSIISRVPQSTAAPFHERSRVRASNYAVDEADAVFSHTPSDRVHRCSTTNHLMFYRSGYVMTDQRLRYRQDCNAAKDAIPNPKNTNPNPNPNPNRIPNSVNTL